MELKIVSADTVFAAFARGTTANRLPSAMFAMRAAPTQVFCLHSKISVMPVTW